MGDKMENGVPQQAGTRDTYFLQPEHLVHAHTLGSPQIRSFRTWIVRRWPIIFMSLVSTLMVYGLGLILPWWLGLPFTLLVWVVFTLVWSTVEKKTEQV